MRSSSRKLLIGLLGLVVLGLVIYFSRGIIHLKDFSGEKLLHAVRHANPYLLILSIAAIYVCYAIRALRWKVFQGNLGPSRFWPIYSMTLAGFSAVFLLGRAGEPVRPVLLARKEGLPFADMFGIYFLERIFDFASMAVIASIGLLLFKSHERAGDAASTLEAAAKTAGTLFSVAVLGAIVFLIYLRLHGTALLEAIAWLARGSWVAWSCSADTAGVCARHTGDSLGWGTCDGHVLFRRPLVFGGPGLSLGVACVWRETWRDQSRRCLAGAGVHVSGLGRAIAGSGGRGAGRDIPGIHDGPRRGKGTRGRGRNCPLADFLCRV